jgi:hypothetical protein
MNGCSDGLHSWTAQLGTWGISSNQAYCPTLSGGAGIATVEYGDRDCTAEVTISTKTNNAQGLALAFTDIGNYFRVYFHVIVGVNRTRVEALGTSYFSVVDGIPWASGDVLKVVLSGNSFQVFRNGSLVMSGTDSRIGNNAGTKQGLYVSNIATRFDDFSIVPA